jgi:hypothetical protein
LVRIVFLRAPLQKPPKCILLRAKGLEMVAYEFYLRDPIRGYHLIGVLPERRGDPKRITKESVLNWGQTYFSNHLNLDDMFFIDVEMNGETIRLL